MSLSALCKVCFHYNHGDKTCGRSVIAVNKGKLYHDYAKTVRLDDKRCGPQGKWYKETSPADELMESFDI